MSDKVVIYTDGSCLGNPGVGGWAALLMHGKHQKLLKGSEYDTTNNRMELLAAIEGLRALKRPAEVDIWTDSQYVRRGMTEWIHNWVKNNWRSASKKPVKNSDLWVDLLKASEGHQVSWHWVKGHSGDKYNEQVDEAARDAAVALSMRERGEA